MPRPRIGISVDSLAGGGRYMSPVGYAAAVVAAGGRPVLLPFPVGVASDDACLAEEYVDDLDGLLLPGGDDLNAVRWGEPMHPQAVPVEPAREAFDFALLHAAIGKDLPVLGICLGCQEMNVAYGGSIIQFLPDDPRDCSIEHRRTGDDWSQRHDVAVTPGGVLANVTGVERLSVNSSHKQAIGRLGGGLTVEGVAPDGVIEAVSNPDCRFFLGVQWHAERQFDEPNGLKIFQAFISVAGLAD